MTLSCSQILLSRLVSALVEHLDAEESRLLPIMARHITEPEWAEFTARGMEAIPKKQMFLGFGMMLYEGDPEVIAIEMRSVPAPVRALLPIFGRGRSAGIPSGFTARQPRHVVPS